MTTKYGDITPRQAGYSVANFLKRAAPNLVIERFGQVFVMPKNNTQTAKFRRYYMEGASGAAGPGDGGDYSNPQSKVLEEGVTPTGSKLASRDYTVTLVQYGDWMGFTDVMVDTHEDFPQALREMSAVLGESAAETIEHLRFNVLKAGTNVFYADGVESRGAVNGTLNLQMQRRITRSLKRQNAKPITNIGKSSPAYETLPIEAAFIALVHPDLENDIRNMVNVNGESAFISTKHYAGIQPMEGEIGSVEDVRYIRSTVFESWADAGGVVADADVDVLSSGGTDADVYPILYLARDAFGIVPLKGESSVNISWVNPKPTETDPLGQRGTAGYKFWTATVILQDAFLVRAEVAATN